MEKTGNVAPKCPSCGCYKMIETNEGFRCPICDLVIDVDNEE